MRLAGLALLTLAAMASDARPHDWYSGTHDPVTGGQCCSTAKGDGYGDCHTLDIVPGVLTPEADGYRLRLTLEQARKINPRRNAPVDTLIPWKRIQPAADGKYAVCIPSHQYFTMKHDFYCFFEPPNT